ncbi:MAG TPA: amino acid-binding protein [Mycobacterium sp.]|nr:amino acid-binding protein [Mycobacterium sp.]
MATDLTLYLDDEPGELALIGDVLGKAGANISGLCAVTSGGGQAEVHVLVEDPTPAFEALQHAGIQIASEQEVIVLEIQDRPGALAEVARKLGNTNVNLTIAYLATNTRLVLAADNLAEAKAALAD